MYYRTYTCISDLIHVLYNLYMYFRSYTCITKLILVLLNLFLYFRACTSSTELIHVFKILFMCEGTRKYDKSEQLRLIQIHIRYGH